MFAGLEGIGIDATYYEAVPNQESILKTLPMIMDELGTLTQPFSFEVRRILCFWELSVENLQRDFKIFCEIVISCNFFFFNRKFSVPRASISDSRACLCAPVTQKRRLPRKFEKTKIVDNVFFTKMIHFVFLFQKPIN